MKSDYERIFDELYLPLLAEEKFAELKKIISSPKPYIALKNNRIKSELLQWILDNQSVSDTAKRIIQDELTARLTNLNLIQLQFQQLTDKLSVCELLDTSIPKLNYVLYKLKDGKKYFDFEIYKRSGGKRVISAPIEILKNWQRKLNLAISLVCPPKYVVHGFARNKSIITNAKKHIDKRVVINIDIKDFFPSINFGRIRGLFLSKPFNFNSEVSTILAQICCSNGVIPQGAPTSPILSNLICSRLDQKLMKLAQEYFCMYTRYADDITFSTRKKLDLNELLDKVRMSLKEEGFEPNEKKIRTQTRNMRQEVTGLTVNKKVNINRKYIRKTRAILHSWKSKGYEQASLEYHKSFDRNRLNKPKFEKSLLGKIEFIGNIKGKEDSVYKKLRQQFETLNLNLPNEIEINVADNITIQEIVSFNQVEQSEKVFNANEVKNIIPKDEFIKKLLESDRRLPHNPEELVKQLSKFTHIDSYLKKLVHSSKDDEEFDLIEILSSARNEFESMKEFLPSFFINSVNKELFELYEKDGLRIWEANNRIASPYDLDKKFESDVIQFKKKYRFGENKEDSANLYDLFQKLISEKRLNVLIGRVEISEEIKKANFYTDVEGIKLGLRIFLENIVQKLLNTHKVKIDLRKEFNGALKPPINFVDIDHIGSVASLDAFDLEFRLNNLQGEFSDAKMNKLKSRCDWHIQSKFQDGKCYEIKVLDKQFRDANSKAIEISELQEPLFRHRLIFY